MPTKQQKIELIRQKCIEANPEIMELKFGCRVEYIYKHHLNSKSSTFITKNGLIIKSYANNQCFSVILDGNKNPSLLLLSEIKNKGREIRLSDVLLALGKTPLMNESTVCSDGYFYMDIGERGKEIRIMWNLKNDDINLQSQSTIDSIANFYREKEQ